MTVTPDTWIQLKRLLDADEPPPAELYVRPKRSCAQDIAEEIASDPQSKDKFLLVGARGGGKSTELREIGRLLRDDRELAEVDLDASGVSAVTVTAFDLVYLSSIAVLRLLNESQPKRASALFESLKAAYSDEDEGDADNLGDFDAALAGLAGFATLAADAAGALGGVPGAGTAVGTVMGALAGGIRLLPKRTGPIPETSPLGRGLQAVANQIGAEVAETLGRPICVLVDGLEKINGQSTERFRQVFEMTRLLADLPWAMVFAAPPCTLSETNSVDGRGFQTRPVWGFGPDDLGSLVEVLTKRLDVVGLRAEEHVSDGDLDRLVEESGGLPRHAIKMLWRAAELARRGKLEAIDAETIDAAIDYLGETLSRGLHTQHEEELRKTARSGLLSGSPEAATLFADGRILALPPEKGSRRSQFAVHPLLLPGLREAAERGR